MGSAKDGSPVPLGKEKRLAVSELKVWIDVKMTGKMGGLAMTIRVPLPPSGFDDLSADEKVEYVQSLWDRIAASADEISVPKWHRVVIRQRLTEDRGNLAEWSEVRDKVTQTSLR